jgi:hypothetical protein
LYAVSLGFVITNLGIIARQRIFIFPFFFALIEASHARTQSRDSELDAGDAPAPEQLAPRTA